MSDNNSNSNMKYNFYDNDLFLYISIPVSVLITTYALYYIFFTSNQYKAGVGIVWIVINCLIWIPYAIHKYNINQQKSNLAKKKAKKKAKAEREASLEENAICNINPNLCMHGGSCQSFGDDKQQFRCTCTAGWTGNNCNTPDNITIKDSDVDSRCSDKTTGEKNVNMEWCNANFDGRGGKCVDKQKYQIDCPVNRDGTPNFKYNEYGCDVDNDEVWCEETSADSIGKCVVRSAEEVGEPCNVSTESQDCGGRRCLDWHNGKGTCVANNQNEMVYNAKIDGCNTFECSKYNSDPTNCSNTFYCNYNNDKKKCKVKSREHCQSKDEMRCEDDSNCLWDDRHHVCSDKKSGSSYGSDCVGYSKNKNICNKLSHCKYDDSSNLCKYNTSKESSGIHAHLGISNDININFYSDISDDNSCGDGTVQSSISGSKCEMVISGYTPSPSGSPAPVVAQVVAPAPVPAPVVAGQNTEGFKVGGRIKKSVAKKNNGFVVGGLSSI